MFSHFMGALRRRSVGFGLPLITVACAYGQSAPSGIWATAASGSVNLNWNAVPGASYNIYRGTTSGHEAATPIASTQSTGYTDTTAANGTTYYYEVAAVYGTSVSPKSGEASCKPGTTLAGSSIPVTFAGANQVTVAYSAVPSATFYRTFRYNTSLGWQLLGTTTALSFTDSTALNGTEYSYEVVPGDAATDGNASFSVTAVPGDAPLGNPSITDTTPGNEVNNVNWSPVPGAQGYVVYRGKTSNGEGAQPYAIVGGNYFTDNAVVNGTTYYYTIAALDYSGTGAVGPETSGTPGSTQLAGGLMTATANATSVSLNWQPVTGATSYYILRGDGNYYNNQTFVAKTTATSYTDSAVAVGGTYYYAVLPATVKGLGTNGAIASAKVGDGGTGIPAGLTALSQATDVQLSWNPVAGASGYAVYRATSGTPTLYAIAYGTGFTDTAAKAGVPYIYQIAAFDTDSESGLSTTVTGEINEKQLPAPMATGTVSGSNVTIYWSLVPGAASYDVFRAVNGGPYLALTTGFKPGVGSTSGAFTDATAPAGLDCLYYVCAVNSASIGISSNTVSAGTGNSQPPVPMGTFATASTTSGGADAINVTCNPITGIGNFNVYRGTKSGGEGVLPYAENVGSFYQDPNVKAGVTYFYTFTSVDADGQSAFSPECSCTWGATPLPATVLTAYSAATQVTLDWAPITGATSYDVFKSIGNGPFLLYQQNVTTTTLVDTNVSSNQSVSYQVYALNAQGAGNRSNTVTARSGSTQPGVTSGIWVVSTGTGATLTWNRVTGNNVSYNVFRSRTSGGEGAVPIAVGVQGNEMVSFNDATALSGIVYYYTVTVVTTDGQGEQSAEVSVKAKSSQLVAPTLSAVTTTGKVALSWTSVPGATSYNIFRSDPILGAMLYQQGVTGTAFTDTNVISGVQYVYVVAAVSVNGEGIQSNAVAGTP